jgi:hypothetical protein
MTYHHVISAVSYDTPYDLHGDLSFQITTMEFLAILLAMYRERDTSTSFRLSINGVSSGVSRFESTIFIRLDRSYSRAFRIRFNQTIVDIVT